MTARLLTVREVAEMLDVSTETILRWVRAGKLPAIKLPSKALRFHEDALDAWIGERATPGPGVLTTSPDAARGAGYLRGVESAALTTRPRPGAATDDQE